MIGVPIGTSLLLGVALFFLAWRFQSHNGGSGREGWWSQASRHLQRHLPARFVYSAKKKLLQAGMPARRTPGGLALTMVSGAFLGAIAGGVAAVPLGSAGPGVVLGSVFGGAVPWLRLDDNASVRTRRILRELPAAIEMISLCLRAGMDFPGALETLAGQMPESSPLRGEFSHMGRHLALGRSRAESLRELAVRVGNPQVDRFVGSVLMSEKKGTPLSRVLTIQADVLRTRRSQAAEQAAARASLLLLGPLCLIFLSVFVLLLGPFLIKAINGQLFG